MDNLAAGPPRGRQRGHAKVYRFSALLLLGCALISAAASPVLAGPPYLTDDPEPTDYKHFEIYAFGEGTATRDGNSGESGIDFNYGAAPNLQLTATVPAGFAIPVSGSPAAGLSNVELAAKYRFLTQEQAGVDVAIFPRLFLPSASTMIGERHASVLFPLWLEKDWGSWSAFGGGGCEINRGGDSQNFCMAGAVVTNQITKPLQIGVELFHQTPDTQGNRATTLVGAGFRYDLSENFHLLGYLGRGIANVDATDRYNWYTSVLFTF